MCGHWWATEFPEVPAGPGDEITVILYPAPGALPGVDPDHDEWTEVLSAPHNAAPNRRIGAITRAASPGGGSDLIVELLVESGAFAIPLDLSTEVAVHDLAGNPLAGEIIGLFAASPSPFSCDGPLACTTPDGCTLWNVGPVSLGATCLLSPSQYQNCTCTLAILVEIDAVPVDPGDEIIVILKPAPGGMPELPGFEDDEESVPEIPGDPPFRRGDCNADGSTDIGDPIALLGELFSGAAPGTCADACDSNDDGGKDIADAIYLLGGLFSGGPLPPAPVTACGPDPTQDALRCGAFPPCTP
jgi:hypothetical protein